MHRICQLITRLVLGGAQRIALETADFLARSGWEVELWSGPQTGPEGSLHEEARRRGVVLREVPDLVRQISPRRDALALAWLRRELARGGFDIVHTHSSKAGILGRHAAVQARVPLRVHTVHGWGITPATSLAARQLFAHLERRAAREAQTLIAVSEAVRDFGLSLGIGQPGQYRVIHGGIVIGPVPDAAARRAARERLGLPEDASVIGTIGRLDHAKDPIGALRALLPLLEAQTSCRAVFVGDGPLRAQMTHAVAGSGAADRITLAGRCENARTLLPAFDLFFLSSRWEGFPLAVVEAMAAVLPVVAYQVAGVREAVADGVTGHLVPPGDARAWRECIARLLGDTEARRRMGAAGRQRAQDYFGLEPMLVATRELYQDLLARRG